MYKRWLIVSVSVVTLLLVVLFLLRHILIGHALEVSIKKKTNQTLTFNIGDVKYNILSNTVSFDNSNFTFSNLYIDKNKSIQLSEFAFDELEFKGLSVLKLIFEREVVADKLMVISPGFWFKQQDNPVPFREKPREIIKTIKQHPNVLGDLVVKINEIEIANGSMDLKADSSYAGHKGSVDFHLLLKDFNTTKSEDTSRLFFAKEHFVSLSDFGYYRADGDSVAFDSLVFKTNNNSLIIYDLLTRVQGIPSSGKTHNLYSKINELRLRGLEFNLLNSTTPMVIDSIIIRTPDVTLFNEEGAVDTVSHRAKHDIFKRIPLFVINDIFLENAIFTDINANGDTLVDATNISFRFDGIEIDSTIRHGKLRKADYSGLILSSGAAKYYSPENRIHGSFDSVVFSGNNNQVTVINITINDTADNSDLRMENNISELSIKGLSIDNYLNGIPLQLSLDIISPHINMVKYGKHSGNSSHKEFSGFYIDDVNISDGDVDFRSPDVVIKFEDISVNGTRMGLKSLHNLHHTDGKNYSVDIGKANINVTASGEVVSFHNASLRDDIFTLSEFGLKAISENINLNLLMNKAEISGVNIPEIIDQKEFNLSNIIINKPYIRASIQKKNNVKNSKAAFADAINIDNIELLSGNFDIDFKSEKDTIKAVSDFDVDINNIVISDLSNSDWIKNIDWNVDLENTEMDVNSLHFLVTNLLSVKDSGLIRLRGLAVDPVKLKKFEVGCFTIKEIEVLGLVYDDLLDGKISDIASLKIFNPVIDMHMFKVHNNGSTSTFEMPHFNMGEFELANMELSFRYANELSTSHISMGDFDVYYKNASSKNYINGLHTFSVSDLSFSDTTKNNYFKIADVAFDQGFSEIDISGIEGGNIFADADSGYLHYDVAVADIDGLDVSESYPHTIVIDSLVLDNLTIDNTSAGKPKSKKTRDINISLPGVISSFRMNYFAGLNIDVKHDKLHNASGKVLNDIGIELRDISIDSVNSGLYDIAGSLSVDMGDNSFTTSDSLYAIGLSSMSYNFDSNLVVVDSFHVIPRYEEEEFFKNAAYQTDMMNISIDRIDVSGADLGRMLDNKEIVANTIDVYGLNSILFRNKRYPIKPGTYKKMPAEALSGAAILIDIDSVVTHNAFVKYKEITEKSIVPGEIFFNKFNLNLKNITNDTASLNKTPFLVASLNTMLMGKASLDMNATFNLTSDTNDFWVSGKLDKIDFTELNSLTQNLVGISLSGGTGELNIPLISGNSYNAMGSLQFRYKKLKVDLYDREKASNTTGLSGSMANLLLNDIFIKSNNPGFLGRTKEGEVYFTRDTEKSVIAYIWKSTLSGLMSTMGYNNREQRQEKRKFRKMLRDLQ